MKITEHQIYRLLINSWLILMENLFWTSRIVSPVSQSKEIHEAETFPWNFHFFLFFLWCPIERTTDQKYVKIFPSDRLLVEYNEIPFPKINNFKFHFRLMVKFTLHFTYINHRQDIKSRKSILRVDTVFMFIFFYLRIIINADLIDECIWHIKKKTYLKKEIIFSLFIIFWFLNCKKNLKNVDVTYKNKVFLKLEWKEKRWKRYCMYIEIWYQDFLFVYEGIIK